MFKYFIVRIIWLFIILLFIISLLFFVTRLGMIELYTRPDSIIKFIPLVYRQYIQFLKDVINDWNWGYVPKRNLPAWDLLLQKAPNTLFINFIAFILYVPIGILLGIISAVKKKSIYDYIISIFTLVFSSIPSFILIFVLIYFLGYQLNWFPPQYPAEIHGNEMKIKGLVIPILALSAGPISNLTRLVRGELIEEFESKYFIMLQTKGLSRRQSIFRHALRNCMVPVIPAILNAFIFVLCGSFFIEIVYGVPGIAKEFFDGMLVPYFDKYKIVIDSVRIVMIGAFYTTISLSFGLIIDISYGFIDPRIRIGSKE